MGSPEYQAVCSSDPENKEKIILDVRLTEMINNAAFRGVLQNGHEIVAYVPARKRVAGGFLSSVGDMVAVSMSPFDMSRGEILLKQD